MLHLHPSNCLVSHQFVEMLFAMYLFFRFDWPGVLKDWRVPLIGIAAHESVEVLEPETRWPQIERSCLARHPVRHVVHFAVPRGVIAVFFENFSHASRAFGYE